jgi:hypothetical protein
MRWSESNVPPRATQSAKKRSVVIMEEYRRTQYSGASRVSFSRAWLPCARNPGLGPCWNRSFGKQSSTLTRRFAAPSPGGRGNRELLSAVQMPNRRCATDPGFLARQPRAGMTDAECATIMERDQRKRGFNATRAPRFITNTITMSSKAPPHACSCHDLYGEIA